MKRIFFSFVLLFATFLFLADSSLAQTSVAQNDGLPTYDQLKKEVAQLPGYVQELKRLRKSLQRIHGEFSFPFRTCVSKDTSYEKAADALTSVLSQISLQRADISYVAIGVFSINNVNAADYGWTSEQIADAVKWKKVVRNAIEDIADINKIHPSEEEGEELLSNLIDHIRGCNNFY